MLKLFVKTALAAAVLAVCMAGHANAKPKFEEVHLEQVYSTEQDAALPNDAPSQVFVDWEDGKWTEVRTLWLSPDGAPAASLGKSTRPLASSPRPAPPAPSPPSR